MHRAGQENQFKNEAEVEQREPEPLSSTRVGFRSAGTGMMPNDGRSIPHRETENQLKSFAFAANKDTVHFSFARMLAKLGFTVLRAGGGGEAIDIFRQQAHGLDLVVLDLVMPGIGGEEVYRRIKAIRPDTRVLISSGFDPSGGMTESLQRDRDGFLRKPFTLGELSEKVQELLRKC